MSQQIALFDITEPATVTFGTPDLDTYDFVVVFFSGGKDSVAAVLDLLDRGGVPPRDKIELHHHRVDGGAEGSDLFDWPVTDAYVAAFAKAFGLKLYFSWKEGGLEGGEMLRNNELTKPAWFTTPDGELVKSGGESGKLYPAQVSGRDCFTPEQVVFRVRKNRYWQQGYHWSDPFLR